ncbi:GNAT acetyltransferase [Desulfonatronum zhilinae]|nr:GNAT acetyltransferase [Desulfonatronum zhilinae]
MSLHSVEPAHVRGRAFTQYAATSSFFPIIGMVLEAKQDGWIMAANPLEPSSLLVVHKFGFCQVVDLVPNNPLDHAIVEVLSGRTVYDFLPSKLRVYAVTNTWFSAIQADARYTVEESQRVRFLPGDAPMIARPHETLTMENIYDVSAALGLELGSRFWNSSADAVLQGLGCFLRDAHGNPASLCYAAAVSNNTAEIDVMTHPELRAQGLAVRAVQAFVGQCRERGIIPLWDCFANNSGSVQTALRCGFNRSYAYRFLTIKPTE